MRYGLLVFVFFTFTACGDNSKTEVDVPKQAVPTQIHKPRPDPPSEQEDVEESQDAGQPEDNGGQVGLFSSGKPMLIDFKRDHCLPCRLMKPWIASLQKKYGEKAAIVRINLDKKENASLAKYFKVITIPTQIYLSPQGRIVMRHVGIATEKEMKKALDKILAGS